MLKCRYCNKVLEKYKKPAKTGNYFCDRACHALFRKGKPNTMCSYCGVPIHVWPRRLDKLQNSYCGKSHYLLHQTKQFILKKGYKKILLPFHPRADAKGYTFEHIIVLETKLRRPLHNQEVTHHLDGNKLNNHPDNLIAVENNAIHLKRFH